MCIRVCSDGKSVPFYLNGLQKENMSNDTKQDSHKQSFQRNVLVLLKMLSLALIKDINEKRTLSEKEIFSPRVLICAYSKLNYLILF